MQSLLLVVADETGRWKTTLSSLVLVRRKLISASHTTFRLSGTTRSLHRKKDCSNITAKLLLLQVRNKIVVRSKFYWTRFPESIACSLIFHIKTTEKKKLNPLDRCCGGLSLLAVISKLLWWWVSQIMFTTECSATTLWPYLDLDPVTMTLAPRPL